MTENNTSHRYMLPYLDTCEVVVTSEAEEAELTYWNIDSTDHAAHIDEVSETRTVHGGAATFDLSPYCKQAATDKMLLYWLTGGVTSDQYYGADALFRGYAEVDGSPIHFCKMPGTRRYGESYNADRTHLANPNFPMRVTGVYAGKPIVERNGTLIEGNIKKFEIDTDLQVGVFAWDTTPVGYQDSELEFGNLLDPKMETTTVTLTADVVKNWSGTRKEHWLLDCRTEGVFLRFFDHTGNIQQLLLDISSTERKITQDKLMQGYQRQTNETDMGSIYLVGGAWERAKKSTAEIIHAGLNDVTDAIYQDLCDLASSPVVAMYDKPSKKWLNVRVSCGSILNNAKDHKVSADFDIYTQPINTL